MRTTNHKSGQVPRRQGSAGQAMLIAVIFFLIISSTVVLGVAAPILRQVKIGLDTERSKRSYFLAQAGIEDTVFRLVHNKSVLPSETLSIGSDTVTTDTSDVTGGKLVVATGNSSNAVRKVQTRVVKGTGISFHYGVQAGNGGFDLRQSSQITGNVFAGGPVTGEGNIITGDVISAGPNGLIKNVHVKGAAFAHTIGQTSKTTIIDKDAYFTNKLGTVTVGGAQHPNSPDQPIVPLPISDEQIVEWETEAEAGGVIDTTNGCTGGVYEVSSSVSLGPVKIACNLVIKSTSAVVTITGPIWVTGNITTQTKPQIKMDPSLGDNNVAIIADNPSNRLSSGLISVENGTIFETVPGANSFIFLISQNNSAENGGTTDAISIGQSAAAVVAYASHGQITLGQSVDLDEVTAYKIVLTQTANVQYNTGLPSVLFSSGPSGGYDIVEWQEVE